MNTFKKLIFGGFLMIIFVLTGGSETNASYCVPNQNESHYKKVYCQVNPQNNEDADKAVVNIVSKQFDLEPLIIDAILSNSFCTTFKEISEEAKAKLPSDLKVACNGEKNTTGQQLFAQNLLTDVKNAYQKEKAMHFNQQALEYKLKASEDYWDGRVGGPLDAPFDLISDLNLIEIILFGSKAQWMGDVFSFPEKDQNKEQGEIIPLDELIQQKADKEKKELENKKDEGVNFEEDNGPDCVLPDDPNADPNANPGNPLCGDGKIDLLKAEQCDDGNNTSGDGCNQFCQSEINGTDKMCIDPDAITFKKPVLKGGKNDNQNQEQQNQEAQQNQCPPGTVPSKIPKIWGDGNAPVVEVPQAQEYPGPSIGGTLKQFPESEKPTCSPGYTPVQITVAGKKEIAKGPNGEARCLPTEFCADFDKARDFLFGKDWEDDKAVVNIAPAVEAMFCVDVVKNNRPLTPYSMIEGCVDCHISSMVDSLEKALTTNVTPYKNTTSAFGVSSKFGPTFSFNLLTATKPKVKTKNVPQTPQLQEKTNANFEDVEKNTIADQSSNFSQSALTTLTEKESQLQTQAETLTQNTREYNWSTGAMSDFELGERVVPLLIQMDQSFQSIQDLYADMVNTTGFNEKLSCK